MISWKHSFDGLNVEYETAKKKRQALDTLLETGRISQSTHDMFSMEITEAVTEIETRQKGLLQKISAKTAQLGEQVKTLEILLTDYEIQHVTGEIDEETYQRQINVLSLGLETSRLELDSLTEAGDQLANPAFTQQDDKLQATKMRMTQENSQDATVEFEPNEADSTTPPQTELQSAETPQPTEQPVKAEKDQ